jgi:predicted PurR-regulated permease PerM
VIRELALAVVLLLFARPLLGPIAYAAVLAVALYPVYRRYKRRYFGLLLVLVSVAVLVVLAYFVSVNLFDQLTSLADLYGQLSPETRVQLAEFSSNLPLQDFAIGLATSIPSMALNFTFFVIFAYYFLVDGHRLEGVLRDFLPRERAEAVAKEGWENLNSVVTGVFVVMFLYMLLSTAVLSYTNSPSPLLYSFVSALFSPLPLFGAWMAYVYPFYLHILAGNYTSASILAVFQAVWYAVFDPYFRTRYHGTLHPGVLLGSMAAGMAYFGFSGILVGPLIATGINTLASVRHYEIEPLEAEY